MGLEDEYAALVRAHGLEPPTDDRSVREKLKELRHLATSAPEEADRRRATEVLQMISLLDRETDGAVSKRLAESGERAQSYQLSDYLEAVKEKLASRGALLPADVYFNVFPTGEFNAVALPAQAGYLCLLNTGLLRLLSNIARACCYPVHGNGTTVLLTRADHADRQGSATFISLAVAVRVILNYLSRRTHEHPLPADHNIEPWGGVYATGIARAMKVFVLAHEMGHVALGHCAQGLLQTLPTPVGELNVLSKSHQQEFGADAWAQEMLGPTEGAEESFVPLAAGGVCFLTVHLMLLQVRDKLTTREANVVHASHPPSTDRIAALRAILQKQFADEDLSSALRAYALAWRVLQDIKASRIEVSSGTVQIWPRPETSSDSIVVEGQYTPDASGSE